MTCATIVPEAHRPSDAFNDRSELQFGKSGYPSPQSLKNTYIYISISYMRIGKSIVQS